MSLAFATAACVSSRRCLGFTGAARGRRNHNTSALQFRRQPQFRHPRRALTAASLKSPFEFELCPEKPDLVVNSTPKFSFGLLCLEQPIIPAVFVVMGVLLLNPSVAFLGHFVCLPGRRMDILITGVFIPAIGILFAMLSSTAFVALRQRQEDCRDIVNLELASIRMLGSMIDDPELLEILLEYTRTVDAETFSHRENNIIYEERGIMSRENARRELIFAYADELLHSTMRRINRLRMREDVEKEMRRLMVLRSRRRATLDSGFPAVHFNIIGVLGSSIPLAFLVLLAEEPLWLTTPAVPIMWGILIGVLAWGGVLMADMRDPFRGRYRLSPSRMRRTLGMITYLVDGGRKEGCHEVRKQQGVSITAD